MDPENTNECNYTYELEYIVQLITALEYIVRVLEEHPVRYPPFIRDVVCLQHGRMVRWANGNEALCNGLEQQIEELYTTMEALELEVDYESGGEGDGPDEGMV